MFDVARALATLAVVASIPTAQSVSTVDPSGGSTALIDAVQAAQPGDTLVVLPGTYDAPQIEVPLNVLGSGAPGAVLIDGKMHVGGLGAGEAIVLRGLSLDSSGPENEPTLDISGGSGSVWIEDCEILGAQFALESLSPFNTAVRVDGTAGAPLVTLMRCAMRGGYAFSLFPQVNNKALAVDDASVFVYGSTMEGAGSSFGPQAALEQTGNSEVFLAGSEVLGVDGFDNFGLVCETDGGPAANVFGGVLRILDTNVAGGAPGSGTCGGAVAGPDFQISSLGQLVELPGDTRSYQANSPVAVGETLTLEFDGLPFDLVALALSSDTTPSLFLPWNGAILGSGSSVVRFFGLLPASGSLSLDITLSPTGDDVLTVFSQAVFVTQTELFLGSGSVLTLLATAP